MSRDPSWKIADLIDFEFLLAGDEGGEGREFFEKNVRPQLGPDGEGDRRKVFKIWLEARRGDAGKWPGSRCAAAGKAVASLGGLLGIVLGASVTVGLLHYKGDEPVNVAWFFACTVGVQLLLLVAAAGLWLVRRVTRIFDEFHPLRELLAGLAWALAAGLRKLPGAERARLRAALAVLGRKREIYGSLAAWPFLITTQIFAVAYNVGILAVLVAHVAMMDLAFAWQSSLHLGPEAAHRLVSALAAPWAWAVPNAQPTLAEITASRFSYSEGIAPLDRAALVSWWPFLAYAVAFYGLLLRGGLLVFAALKLRVALRSLAFDHEGCNALHRRLTGPVVAAQDGTARLEISGVAISERAHAGRGGECVALVAADVELPTNQPADYIGAAFGWRVRETRPAQIDHPSGNADALAALADRAPLASVVVVARARRAPIKAIALFLQSVTESAGPNTEVVLLLVGRATGASFAPVGDEEFTHWRNFRAIHGLRVSLEKWSAA
ncbi:MAG: DUF2868 domain-containing protein [Chthoniobacter sp.]|nr:DUF2868 domain-containing protein [Chthoniobacter sp.]